MVDYFSICENHKHFRYILNKGHILALYAYTSLSCYSNLTLSQRNNNYKKWFFFDQALFGAIRHQSLYKN